MLLDELESLVYGGKHAQREEVDLNHASVVYGVFVPLDETAAFHGGLLQRHHLDEGARGDDHATDVLADVTREAGYLLGEFGKLVPERGAEFVAIVCGAPHLLASLFGRMPFAGLRETVQFSGRQAQRFANLTHGAAEAVGGEGGDKPHMFASQVLINAKHQLLPDLAREVEVDF